MNRLKKHPGLFAEYLQIIPPKTVGAIFKSAMTVEVIFRSFLNSSSLVSSQYALNH
jgi:hypothetical protein